MPVDLDLPGFSLDCRNWLVATEGGGLLVDDTDDGPVVAVLSTALVVDGALVSAQAVLTLALLDHTDTGDDACHDPRDVTPVDGRAAGFARPPASGPQSALTEVAPPGVVAPAGTEVLGTDGDRTTWASQDICVLDADWVIGYARVAVAAPGGELAVVAEFTSAPNPGSDLIDRFYDLVTSFRWAA